MLKSWVDGLDGNLSEHLSYEHRSVVLIMAKQINGIGSEDVLIRI